MATQEQQPHIQVYNGCDKTALMVHIGGMCVAVPITHAKAQELIKFGIAHGN